MTDSTQLKRQEAAIEAELKRRNTMTDTEAQIMAAREHNGRPIPPDIETDTSKWSTTERQAFAARGVKPLRRHESDDD